MMNKFASLLQKIATLKKIAGPGFIRTMKQLNNPGKLRRLLGSMSNKALADTWTNYNKARRVARALGGVDTEDVNQFNPKQFSQEVTYNKKTPEQVAKAMQWIQLRSQGKIRLKDGTIVDRTNKSILDKGTQGLGGKSGAEVKPDPTPNPEVINPETTTSDTTQQVLENLGGGRPSWFARHPIWTNTIVGGGSLAAGFGLGRGTASQRTPQEILNDQYTKVNSNFWQRLGGAPDYYYKKK